MAARRTAHLAGGVTTGLVLFFGIVRLHSPADELLRVPPELRPTNGLFYSFQNPDHPPLPFNLFPELPLYWVEEDSFLIDDESVDYDALKALWAPSLSASPVGQLLSASSSEDCGTLTVPAITSTWTLITNRWTNMTPGESNVFTNVVTNISTQVSFSVEGVPTGTEVDVFGTFDGHAMTDPTAGLWYYLGRAADGQQFVVSNGACQEGWYLAACTNDTDGDGLGDAYELLVSKTSPDTNHSVNAIFDDGQMDNVLVNGLWQDWGNEQNTQFETTCVVAGTNIIVAWVDSNQGVYGLGGDSRLENYTPQLVAYAVSTDGGRTFHDKGTPPKSLQGTGRSDDGDAGDPVLALDRVSGDVYLVGTSARNQGNQGIPFWKSSDGGLTFGEATNVLDAVQDTDKPWVVVDDWSGNGQHDVYVVASKGSVSGTSGIWLTVSSNGWMTNWSAPHLLRDHTSLSLSGQSAVPVVGSNHVLYVLWVEVEGMPPNANTNVSLRMIQVSNRGTTTGAVHTVLDLATSGKPNGNLALKRSNTASSTDTFKVPTLPVPAVNPITNHLYVAFADVGTNINDRADVFLTWSTDSGTNWSSPRRVNIDATTNDQWMPVLALKPDGSQLFMAWYDRRNDTNNGLMEVYGLFAEIESDGSVDLTNALEFPISSTRFPMVFAGTRGLTDTNFLEAGYYDPVYPPEDVDLHWWYPEWPTNVLAQGGIYSRHVGEYNGVFADGDHVYLTWTDYRLPALGSLVTREQSDVRLVCFPWP